MNTSQKSAPPPYSADPNPIIGWQAPQYSQPIYQQPVQPQIIHVVDPPASGCPKCHMTPLSISTGYSGCGWCLAICFFPIGILCCVIGCEEKSCSHCGYRFS